MRTDSLRLSQEATDAARQFIGSRYGAAYVPANTKVYKAKSNAQDAHEAIRPTDVNLTPEDVKKSLTAEQFKLYRLIWSRFVACQMTNAVYDTVSIDVNCHTHLFRASHQSVKFPGFMAVYVEGKDEDEEAAGSPLPDLAQGEEVRKGELNKAQHFTQPPARFTEASLIKLLEELGIGRPSTYAPTVSTIQDRYYVIREGKALKPTPLGETVNQLMEERFSDIVDPGFTARMEGSLDDVEKGGVYWKDVLRRFYSGFHAELDAAAQALEGQRISVPAEQSDEVCDKCGKPMVVKMGRFGRFLACSGWPDCDFSKPLVIAMPGKCPKCGSRILKKTSRNGYTYYGCERNRTVNGPTCDFMTWDVPVEENCPVCGQTMFKKSGRGAKKPFCINELCSNFTPEELRPGYRPPRKKEEGEAAEDSGAKSAAKTTRGRKTAAKSVSAKKTTKTAAKSTAKKTTKSAAKKTAEPKPKRERTPAQIAATERMRAALAAKKAAAAAEKAKEQE
jgi:DNA topoisomerase-1